MSDEGSNVEVTFLHDAPPPLGPVTQLERVALLDLCPLLKAADELAAEPVTVIDSLHRPFVVSGLWNCKPATSEQGKRF